MITVGPLVRTLGLNPSEIEVMDMMTHLDGERNGYFTFELFLDMILSKVSIFANLESPVYVLKPKNALFLARTIKLSINFPQYMTSTVRWQRSTPQGRRQLGGSRPPWIKNWITRELFGIRSWNLKRMRHLSIPKFYSNCSATAVACDTCFLWVTMKFCKLR